MQHKNNEILFFALQMYRECLNQVHFFCLKSESREWVLAINAITVM
ncbi:Uncharacterised protein [Yersinia pseudotuberculosis]|uniref:Uncharacterized protein n=1 Tax=Yersinia pseudotuberculosis TaxID=633 RepID=A0A380Q9R9_YERPU|nr:Uncharacterised protein [Yersinia pseudotuberculosis]SUP82473.1 Uncharacterised protein [Yersinia pseudotuberculosis]